MNEQNTAPKPFVFVLMPFAPEFGDIYELGIKAACTTCGMHCERVDEQIYEGTILDRIYNQIAKADVVVADMTGRNPNVFYETGYAHALGKRVILLTRTPDDIPFDMKHYPHIIYQGRIMLLREHLERRLFWFARNPSGSRVPNEGLEFFVDKHPLQGSTLRSKNPADHYLKVVIHNTAPTPVNSASLAIVAESEIAGVLADGEFTSDSKLPDGRRLFRLASLENLFPDEWMSLEIKLSRPYTINKAANGLDYDEMQVSVTLRVYYETGPKDCEFEVLFPAGDL